MGGKSKGEQTLSVSRKEVKYLLSLPDRLYLLDALDRLLTPDAYGGYNGYTVRSVYFDSMTNEDYVLSGKLNDVPSGRLFRADLGFLQMCQSL